MRPQWCASMGIQLLDNCGFSIFTRQTTRLYGVDTAETRMVRNGIKDLQNLGKLAKQFVQEALPVGKEVTIKTYKEGKFGRILAEIYINGGDDSLNDLAMAVQSRTIKGSDSGAT